MSLSNNKDEFEGMRMSEKLHTEKDEHSKISLTWAILNKQNKKYPNREQIGGWGEEMGEDGQKVQTSVSYKINKKWGCKQHDYSQ